MQLIKSCCDHKQKQLTIEHVKNLLAVPKQSEKKIKLIKIILKLRRKPSVENL